jgi:hypothetical protein
MKRSIALAALSAAIFLVAASPAVAQTKTQSKAQSNKVTVTTAEPVKVSYAWVVTGLPGMVPNIGQGNELVEGGPRLKLDAGPPVRVSQRLRAPLDLGDDDQVPQLAREALRETGRARLANPLAENGVDDIELDIGGLPNRTVASVAYTTKAGPGTTVKAKAGAIVPGILVLGDPAQTFWRSRNLKVEVNHKF